MVAFILLNWTSEMHTIKEKSKSLLAWSTHKGVFACNRLPFGVKTACAIFQSTIERILQGIKRVYVFFDDILITGETTGEHISNLRIVFHKLQDAGLRLNFEKCEFFQERVKYLGHVIDRNGLHKQNDKIKAIINAPQPKDQTQVKAFVGLVNYYSKFFPNMSNVMSPIYALLQKNKRFEWNQKCENAFQHAKKIISSEGVLAHFNPKLPIKLVCDGSQYGIGAAMFHVTTEGEDKPVCFISRTLTKAEKNYSVIDKEALAIFYGVKKLSHYLLGQKFVLQTDHRPVVTIFGPKQGIPTMAASRLQRWAVFLASFDFEIQYIKGRNNVNADFLSRLPAENRKEKTDGDEEETYLCFIKDYNNQTIDYRRVAKETSTDEILSVVIDHVKKGWPNKISGNELKPFQIRANELTIEKDVIMWGHRTIIPKSLQKGILNELHLAHAGMSKMKEKARAY